MGRRLILSSRFMAKHVTALKYTHAGWCKTGDEVSTQCLLGWKLLVIYHWDPCAGLDIDTLCHGTILPLQAKQICNIAVTLDLYHLTGHLIHTISTYKNSQRYVGCSHHLHPHQVEAAKATNHSFINHYYFQSLRLGSYSLRLEM